MSLQEFVNSEQATETHDERSARIHGRSGRVVRAIEQYNADLSTEQRLAKYRKMAATAYALYRGTNHLFWQDFEWDWRMNRFGSYRTRTWLNGDCHAYNFGAYAEHGVGVVYGLNDFDEGIVADYQYDLWRLAVSLVLIARENGDLSVNSQEEVLDALARTYLKTLAGFVGNHKAHQTVYTSKNTSGRLRKFLEKVERKQSRSKQLEEWAQEVDGDHKFNLSHEDLETVPEEERANIIAAMPAYINTIAKGDRNFGADFFHVEDVAKRVGAGTGSLGSSRYYLLIQADRQADSDDVILDVKAQMIPSAFRYASEEQMQEYHKHFANEGIRHAQCCRALSFHPDDLLGWMELGGVFHSVRERSPFKKSFPTEELTSRKRFIEMAQQWGRGLATEHARAAEITTYRLPEEVTELTNGRSRKFRNMVREIAFDYADQVEEDWEIFLTHLAPADRD